MPGNNFYVTGKIQKSNTGRSFKVYLLDNEKWVFLGLIPKGSLAVLLRNEISQADICKFSQTGQEPLELKP
jgi:hypothetical protein